MFFKLVSIRPSFLHPHIPVFSEPERTAFTEYREILEQCLFEENRAYRLLQERNPGLADRFHLEMRDCISEQFLNRPHYKLKTVASNLSDIKFDYAEQTRGDISAESVRILLTLIAKFAQQNSQVERTSLFAKIKAALTQLVMTTVIEAILKDKRDGLTKCTGIRQELVEKERKEYEKYCVDWHDIRHMIMQETGNLYMPGGFSKHNTMLRYQVCDKFDRALPAIVTREVGYLTEGVSHLAARRDTALIDYMGAAPTEFYVNQRRLGGTDLAHYITADIHPDRCRAFLKESDHQFMIAFHRDPSPFLIIYDNNGEGISENVVQIQNGQIICNGKYFQGWNDLIDELGLTGYKMLSPCIIRHRYNAGFGSPVLDKAYTLPELTCHDFGPFEELQYYDSKSASSAYTSDQSLIYDYHTHHSTLSVETEERDYFPQQRYGSCSLQSNLFGIYRLCVEAGDTDAFFDFMVFAIEDTSTQAYPRETRKDRQLFREKVTDSFKKLYTYRGLTKQQKKTLEAEKKRILKLA